MVACRWIKKNQEDGRSVSKNLAAIKKMIVAAVLLYGTTRLGKVILANAKDNFNAHQVKEAESKMKSEEAYCEMLSQHDTVLALEIPHTSWPITQLKSFLKPLKTKEDTVMQSKEEDMSVWYLQYRDQPIQTIDEVLQEVVQEVGVMPPL